MTPVTPTTSRRKRIFDALAERLQEISEANGYETNAGQQLFWGPVILGPDDEPLALAIVPGATVTNPAQAGKKIITLTVDLHAVVREDVTDAWLVAESVLADIKRAIETDDLTLGGLAVDLIAGEVIPLPKQEGGQTIGLRAEYHVTYGEQWGKPEK